MSRVLTDWLDGFMEFSEYNTEPPLSYKEWVAVSVIAAALRRKCSLPWGTLTFYPNMYILLVGPSGVRKGAAMNPGLDLLTDLGVHLAAEAITREALIQELSNSTETEIDEKAGKLTAHASLTIFSPELTVFLGYNNLQLMSDLVDWYDCRKKWRYRTKHQGEDDITGVWVNIIGATTPTLLISTLPQDAIGGGLFSRIICVYETKKGKPCPAPFIDEEGKRLGELLLRDLKEISLMTGEYKWSKQFIDAYIDWYKKQDETAVTDDPRFDGYVNRRPMHILKLCMILSASRDSSMELRLDTFERAEAMLTRTEVKMFNTFRGFGKSDLSETTASVMRLISISGRITFSELLSKYYYDADKETMQKIIDTLVSMKFCKVGSSEDGEMYYEYNRDQQKKETP